MQWKIKPAPELGDLKYRWRFALFPTKLNSTTWIWLEFYRAEYRYKEIVKRSDHYEGYYSYTITKWVFNGRVKNVPNP